MRRADRHQGLKPGGGKRSGRSIAARETQLNPKNIENGTVAIFDFGSGVRVMRAYFSPGGERIPVHVAREFCAERSVNKG